MSYRTGKRVTNVITFVFGLVVIGFAASFLWLLIQAFSLLDNSVGLTMTFTGYEYISIEATFVALILAGGVYVIRNALRRTTIEIDVEEG